VYGVGGLIAALAPGLGALFAGYSILELVARDLEGGE